jgi:hypothetical protein
LSDIRKLHYGTVNPGSYTQPYLPVLPPWMGSDLHPSPYTGTTAQTMSVQTLGALARKWGIPTWKVRRVFERLLLPEPERISNWRVVRDEDVPALERVLREVGYLPAKEVAHAS